MIGDVLIQAVRKDGRADVTWIASRTEKTLRNKLEKLKIPNGTTNYHELLQDPSLTAVIIASPPFTHLKMVQDALKSGKHVLLEKPMVINREELEILQKTVSNFPDLIAVSYTHLTLPTN